VIWQTEEGICSYTVMFTSFEESLSSI